MRRCFIILSSLLIYVCSSQAQSDHKVVPGIVYQGDTIPVIKLREVTVFSWAPRSKKETRYLNKLMRNVKKVYPYAKLAGIKLIDYEDTLTRATTKKEKKQILKRIEDQIESEYGQDLRDLTFSQGKILLKLVDRETGYSTYDLVSDLKGQLAATFYQAIARIFRYNLKVKYDPKGEDKDIEMIVQMIERGEI